MLFHSPAFIFGFLPLCFLGFAAVHRLWGWDAALLWLAGASLVFYGQWSAALAALLLGSILFNYGAARLLLAKVDDRRTRARVCCSPRSRPISPCWATSNMPTS